MLRRKFVQSAGLVALSSAVMPVSSHAAANAPGTGSFIEQLNKRRLLREILSKYDFGKEMVLMDVNERAGQLYVLVRYNKLEFELRSPNRGISWYTA